MSRKVARACDDCRRDLLSRYRAIADRFLCQECADFFSAHGRTHTGTELLNWLGAEETLHG